VTLPLGPQVFYQQSIFDQLTSGARVCGAGFNAVAQLVLEESQNCRHIRCHSSCFRLTWFLHLSSCLLLRARAPPEQSQVRAETLVNHDYHDCLCSCLPAVGKTWKCYMQSIPSPGFNGSSSSDGQCLFKLSNRPQAKIALYVAAPQDRSCWLCRWQGHCASNTRSCARVCSVTAEACDSISC
jgi:hypothetical protein